jgi:hypothetical protein
MEDVKIQDHIIVVHQLILDQVLVEDVMYKLGQNLVNFLIDMIVYLKVNVEMLIVGNLMIYRRLINV